MFIIHLAIRRPRRDHRISACDELSNAAAWSSRHTIRALKRTHVASLTVGHLFILTSEVNVKGSKSQWERVRFLQTGAPVGEVGPTTHSPVALTTSLSSTSLPESVERSMYFPQSLLVTLQSPRAGLSGAIGNALTFTSVVQVRACSG